MTTSEVLAPMRLSPSCLDDRTLQGLIATVRREVPNEKRGFHDSYKEVEIREVGRLVAEVFHLADLSMCHTG